ncbi:MAG: ABC transporter ATP-binding protein [Chloroflexi bacterium]|nr:ABC transporter ATP-binding protein [Chloroflexota bacterium]
MTTETPTEGRPGVTAQGETLVDVRGLKVYFPVTAGLIFQRKVADIKAVDGVTFQIRKGETLGLVGESGCGKSTTGRAILQLYRPTEGSIKFGDVELTEIKGGELRRMRRKMQMIFQDPYASLNPRMSVGAIVGEPLAIHGLAKGKERRERVAELMRIVGLNPYYASRFPHEFSGGQRQRIGVARALAVEPEAPDLDGSFRVIENVNDRAFQQHDFLAVRFAAGERCLTVLRAVGQVHVGEAFEVDSVIDFYYCVSSHVSSYILRPRAAYGVQHHFTKVVLDAVSDRETGFPEQRIISALGFRFQVAFIQEFYVPDRGEHGQFPFQFHVDAEQIFSATDGEYVHVRRGGRVIPQVAWYPDSVPADFKTHFRAANHAAVFRAVLRNLDNVPAVWSESAVFNFQIHAFAVFYNNGLSSFQGFKSAVSHNKRFNCFHTDYSMYV